METIITNIGKYHFVIISDKKIGIVESSNDYHDALNNVKTYVAKKSNKYSLATVKLSLVSQEHLKENEKALIKFVGGPIRVDIEFFNITNGDLTSDIYDTRSNKLFITQKFLDNSSITPHLIKTIVCGAYRNKLSHKLMVLNTIDKLLA